MRNVRTRRRLARSGPSLRPLSREEARAPRGAADITVIGGRGLVCSDFFGFGGALGAASAFSGDTDADGISPFVCSRPTSRRPGEIIGAAGEWRERLARDQRPRGERIDRGRARAGAAE